MEVVRSHPHRERRVERVVLGGTLWSQNSLLLHNEQDLSIAIPYRPQQVHSPFSIAKGVQTQASPFHLSRGVHTPLVFFWVDHLFQPFFIIVWCMDCLFCRLPSPKPVVPSLAQVLILTRFTATGFLIHSSYPIAMDSWKFIIEVHWTWSELHWYLFDIGRVFFWKERRSWEIFLGFARSCTKPPSWDAHRAYLSFPTFVGTGLSWL